MPPIFSPSSSSSRRPTSPWSNHFITTCSLLCYLSGIWILLYLILSRTSPGASFYKHLSGLVFGPHRAKRGMHVLHTGVPAVLAGILSHIGGYLEKQQQQQQQQRGIVPSREQQRRGCRHRGDWNYSRAAFLLVLLPALFAVVMKLSPEIQHYRNAVSKHPVDAVDVRNPNNNHSATNLDTVESHEDEDEDCDHDHDHDGGRRKLYGCGCHGADGDGDGDGGHRNLHGCDEDDDDDDDDDHRKLHEHDERNPGERLLAEPANTLGYVSMVALGFVLLPLQHNPILTFLDFAPPSIVRFHIWIGGVAIAAALLHAGAYTYLGTAVHHQPLRNIFLPPPACFFQNDVHFENCTSPHACTCQFRIQNLSGLLGLCGFLLIAITGFLRRRWYAWFYRIHIATSVLIFLAALLHWSPAITVLTASLTLYPAFRTLPTLRHSFTRPNTQLHSLRILQMPHSNQCAATTPSSSSSHHPRNILCLTFRADPRSVRSFRGGQYVKLHLPYHPSSHPFSVLPVLDTPDQLRLLLRPIGPFTRQLAERSSLNHIRIDGFFGSQRRIPQLLQHDTAVLLAGGIGITAFLGMLCQIGQLLQRQQHGAAPLERLELHWACRDPHLVQYVVREYLEPVVKAWRAPPNQRLDITIYHTGPEEENDGDDEEQEDEVITMTPEEGNVKGAQPQVAPFVASTDYHILPLVTFTSISIIGLWIVVHSYFHWSTSTSVMSRLWGLLGVLLAAVSISGCALCFQSRSRRRNRDSPSATDGLWWEQQRAEIEAEEECPETFEDDFENVDEDSGVIVDDQELGPDFPENSSIQKEVARPLISSILANLASSNNPGIFICGPPQLVSHVKRASKNTCRGLSSTIAIYEEHFEM